MSVDPRDVIEPRRVIRERAVYLGFDPFIPEAVSVVESGGGRNVYGDLDDPRDGIDRRSILGPDGRYYTSLGPFQERVVGGAGETHLRGGGSIADLFDPLTATDRFIDRYKRAAEVAPIDATPGQIAAAAQRPRDQEGYAAKVDRLIAQLRGSPAPPTIPVPDFPNPFDNLPNYGQPTPEVKDVPMGAVPKPGTAQIPNPLDGVAAAIESARKGAAQLAIAAGVVAIAGFLIFGGIRKTLG